MSKKKKRRFQELMALKGLLLEKRVSYQRLAENVSMGTTTLSDKINGYYDFTADEIEKISEQLEITANEVLKYFFPQMLQNATKSVSNF